MFVPVTPLKFGTLSDHLEHLFDFRAALLVVVKFSVITDVCTEILLWMHMLILLQLYIHVTY
ncbi:hypothetical protein NIES4073_47390 [Kalymmatonema gypsitolerans NIES-4073]|nr:hypothetical protein NIES4073_47390 [Scytonema sp. NIES-4073]